MVNTLFVNAVWNSKICLNKKTLDYIKENNYKKIALFASVQFLALERVKEQLKDIGVEVKTTKAKRAFAEGQILGCDAYHDSMKEDIILNSDANLYVGDGMFHPKALLLSQIYNKEIKPILIYDPTIDGMKIISVEDIKKQIKKLRANLIRFLDSKVVGILVTIKPGQQYLGLARKLKKDLESKGKECFIFIDNTLKIDLLENYPFINSWVNTACPRIGFDDITSINKPLINIREAMKAEESLEKLYHLE